MRPRHWLPAKKKRIDNSNKMGTELPITSSALGISTFPPYCDNKLCEITSSGISGITTARLGKNLIILVRKN